MSAPHHTPRKFRAPGRVNLIGEHTDYNLGFVLPIAIQLVCVTESRPGRPGKLLFRSENQGHDEKTVELPGLSKASPQEDWSDYPIGVARELLLAGFAIEARDITIRSTVPEGSGLSSSASLEVSTALALLDGKPIDPLQLAKLCQKAEVEFVGMPCGIMDQYVSVFGEEHAAIRIDCRNLTHKPVKIPDGVEIVAVNSMVKHELASSAYRGRTQECAAAVDAIQRHHPSVESLRDVSVEQIGQLIPQLAPVPAKRARHVVTENQRVELFVEACQDGDLESMGKLFLDSHRSLQRDYEVSCNELDFLVDTAIGIPGVYGARMTGGGFGGCTVNLVRPDVLDNFRKIIVEDYFAYFRKKPEIYLCRPSEGAGEYSEDRVVV